jgi:hypothetical protein
MAGKSTRKTGTERTKGVIKREILSALAGMRITHDLRKRAYIPDEQYIKESIADAKTAVKLYEEYTK